MSSQQEIVGDSVEDVAEVVALAGELLEAGEDSQAELDQALRLAVADLAVVQDQVRHLAAVLGQVLVHHLAAVLGQTLVHRLVAALDQIKARRLRAEVRVLGLLEPLELAEEHGQEQGSELEELPEMQVDLVHLVKIN